MNSSKEYTRDRIAEEASEWFSRIRDGELCEPDRKRFAQWLAESPVHVREYLGVSAIWGALQVGQHWPEQTSEQLFETLRAEQSGNIVSLQNQSASSPHHPTSDRMKQRLQHFAVAAGLTLIVVTAAGFWLRSERNVYSTARGEQRSVVLSDGSIVQLNTLTRMIVRFDGQQRRIELPRGEAFFRVARDAARPFEVETPFAVVRAIGTEFNVYNRHAGTRVAVVEGRVRVAPRQVEAGSRGVANDNQAGSNARAILHKAASPIALAAGQAVDISGAGQVRSVPDRRIVPVSQTATAWLQRRVVFENERVDRAIDEFNRYNKIQMQVADEGLAALRISGVFSADDPQALMKYLEQIQAVEIRRSGDSFILTRN